jgi:hypothetical protein
MKDKKLILRVAIKLMTIIAISSVLYVFFSGLMNNKSEKGLSVVQIDVSEMKPGDVKFFNGFNKKLLVLYRSADMLAELDKTDNDLLKDISTNKLPDKLNNQYRSFSPEYFVAYAYDPFYGCEIKLSGYSFVPVCINLKYDLAGRVYKSSRAEENMIVPEHNMKSGMMINVYNN